MGCSQSILQRVGIRQLPGVSHLKQVPYPAKCTGHAVNQGGTADKCFCSSLTECIFLSRTFLFHTKAPLTEDISQRSFSCIKEVI